MSEVVAATLDQGDEAGRSVAARRGADGWAVDTASGPVSVAAPRRRQASGPAPLGDRTAGRANAYRGGPGRAGDQLA